MVTQEFLTDQLELIQTGDKRLVTALTEEEIGYWARRHNVGVSDATPDMQAGWHQADSEIAQARTRVQRRHG